MDGEDTDAEEPGATGEPSEEAQGAEAMTAAALERMRAMVRGLPMQTPRTQPRRARGAFTVVEGSGASEGADPSTDGSVSGASTWRRAPGLAVGRTRWREPLGLGAAIGRLAKSRRWSEQAAMGTVMARWDHIVGPDVAAHCAIETFEERRLVVRCTSTAWAKQLVLLLPHIERRIAEEVGPGVVDQVVVRGPSAPSWRRGPRVVPGRGPRDTYG